MNDGSVLILAAIIGMISSVVVQMLIMWGRRNLTQSQATNEDAEANATTSAEWERLYRERGKRIDKAEARILVLECDKRDTEKRFNKNEHQLDISKEFIQYLWMVVVALTNQLKDAGMEPVIIPRRDFRGDDDSYIEDADWDWIEGLKEPKDDKS